jgi:hypothetical protein
MKLLTRILPVLAVGCAAMVPALLATQPASAATPTKFFVSPSASVGGPDSSCSLAGYSTIQSAVDAAEAFELSNPTAVPKVAVCPGTYSEQLTITSNLRISASSGLGSVTIKLPAAAGESQSSPYLSTTNCQVNDAADGVQVPQSVIEICGATAGGANTTDVSVAMSNLNVVGNWPGNVCYDSLYGILDEGGATLNLSNSSVSGIGGDGTTDGCQGGVGVRVGINAINQSGKATLADVNVGNYQKGGIVIDGAGTSATITGGSVTGVGPSSGIAQNGIQISRNATGTVSGVKVSGNECTITTTCGADPWTETQSAGIELYDNGATTISNSKIFGNDVGVASVQASTPATPVDTMTGNTIRGGDESITQDSGNASVTDNSLSSAEIGIWVPQYSGQPSAAEVTAKHDIITNMASAGVLGAGVEVESDGTAGDIAPIVTVGKSDLSNDAYGVLDNSSTPVVATKNYWGSTNGPSGNGIGTGSASPVDVNVAFFPWATSVSDAGTVATTSANATCTASGTAINSAAADAILCLAGPGSVNYSGAGPVLVLGSGSDSITLGTVSTPATDVAITLNGGSSPISANGSAGTYQLENGATATFSGGGSMTQETSPLVTG